MQNNFSGHCFPEEQFSGNCFPEKKFSGNCFPEKKFSGKRDVYLEVAERYERFIRLGVLKNGDKLPSVRVAASELGINPNTVQKAYTYLEEQGLICSLPKKGAFVTYQGEETVEHRQLVLQALTSLKEQGVPQEEILTLIKEVYAHD